MGRQSGNNLAEWVSASLWSAQTLPQPDRPPIVRSGSADVVIVGAGYTGLWTAYYLAQANPGAAIVVIEANSVGFGASGRNGGWCIGELAHDYGLVMHQPLIDTVSEIEKVVAGEKIECDFTRGGELRLARNLGQRERLECNLPPGFVWLDAEQAAKKCKASRLLGAQFSPHTGVLHPLKLVQGLAQTVERMGVVIHERTRATEVHPDRVVTASGTVSAASVVLATEAYTSQLKAHRRDLVPVYSLMVATEPLPDQVMAEIGLADRAVFGDARFQVTYGQRTADNRIAFGARSKSYLFRSRIDGNQESSVAAHESIARILIDMFPVLSDVRFTHRWGGVLGVPRNWKPAVSYDGGIFRAGGYVGEGVAASNLAARTLTDLINGEATALTTLPWVRKPSRRWPIEPLRWAGIRSGAKAFDYFDHQEEVTGKPAKHAELVWDLLRR